MKDNRIAPLEALASYNSFISKVPYAFMHALAYKISFLDEGYGVEGKLVMEPGWKPSVDISPYCPRCGSSNTKFCYYNNYSLTQPRYFCKGCKRYWTKGGSIRNVPIGGGCRKNRRGKSFTRLPTDAVSYYDNKVNALPDQSSSSSAMSDGSHIDLALVFANYLNNQQPENKSGVDVPELPRDFGSCLELTNMESSDIKQLQEENGVVRCVTHFGFSAENRFRNTDHINYVRLESVHEHQDGVQQCMGHEASNYALPPLPGDVVSSQEIVWPDSLQATDQEPIIGPETHDPNVMFGNWSPFDMSCDDTFTRT